MCLFLLATHAQLRVNCIMMAMTTVHLQFNFLCGLRGYHVYRCIWNPVLNETFPVQHEAGNPHDRFAIAGYIGLAR